MKTNLLSKTILVLFIFPIITILAIGCNLFCDGASCCGEKFDTKFEITGLTFSAFLKINQIDSTQTPYYIVRGDMLSSGQSVKFDQLGIQIKGNYRSFSQNLFQEKGSFFSQSFACSPPDIVPNDTIADLQVYSDSDFDALHPKGTSLNDIFEIVVESDYSFQETSIKYPIKLNNFLTKKPTAKQLFSLLLKNPPQSANSHIFTIIFSKTNKQIFKLISPSIIIEP